MVIQRIQTVYLLIAAVLMGLVSFVAPIASVATEAGTAQIYISSMLPLMIVNLLAAVLLLIAVFLFRTLPLQIKVTRISAVLIVLSALIEAYLLYASVDEPAWIVSAVMLVLAFVFSLLAIKGMNKDLNLLRSYDRLR